MECIAIAQLCGLKFRRQHSIEPWVVDFVCPAQKLVVEIDGGYNDNIVEYDFSPHKAKGSGMRNKNPAKKK